MRPRAAPDGPRGTPACLTAPRGASLQARQPRGASRQAHRLVTQPAGSAGASRGVSSGPARFARAPFEPPPGRPDLPASRSAHGTPPARPQHAEGRFAPGRRPCIRRARRVPARAEPRGLRPTAKVRCMPLTGRVPACPGGPASGAPWHSGIAFAPPPPRTPLLGGPSQVGTPCDTQLSGSSRRGSGLRAVSPYGSLAGTPT